VPRARNAPMASRPRLSEGATPDRVDECFEVYASELKEQTTKGLAQRQALFLLSGNRSHFENRIGMASQNAPSPSLVRTPACRAGVGGFDSRRERHIDPHRGRLAGRTRGSEPRDERSSRSPGAIADTDQAVIQRKDASLARGPRFEPGRPVQHLRHLKFRQGG
jgi:hypothetical protein